MTRRWSRHRYQRRWTPRSRASPPGRRSRRRSRRCSVASPALIIVEGELRCSSVITQERPARVRRPPRTQLTGVPNKPHGLATRALHVGQGPDPATGAVVVPGRLATTFAQESPGRRRGSSTRARAIRRAATSRSAWRRSGRHARPGVCVRIGCNDGGDAAPRSRRSRRLHQGARGGVPALRQGVPAPRAGFTAVDPTDPDSGRGGDDRSHAGWLKSPTNPLLRIVDLDAVSELVHGAEAGW